MRNVTIGVIALMGLAFSGLLIYQGQKETKAAPLVIHPPSSPYKSFIAAQGMIESAYKNIPIGSSYSDIITDVYVAVGQIVKKRTPLFKTDTRVFQAQLVKALHDVAVAQAEYENQAIQYNYYSGLSDKNAVSKQAYTTAQYNEKIAAEKLKAAQAQVAIYTAHLERSIVRAPIDGQVMELNIRPGQYAQQQSNNQEPLILFGNIHNLHVRTDIDEEDSWRYEQGAQAIAYVRGNRNIMIPLEYVYQEPYIVPKKSLTGSDLERVDTRVLQVVYRFKKNNLPVFLGQLLDVYIQAKPHEVVS